MEHRGASGACRPDRGAGSQHPRPSRVPSRGPRPHPAGRRGSSPGRANDFPQTGISGSCKKASICTEVGNTLLSTPRQFILKNVKIETNQPTKQPTLRAHVCLVNIEKIRKLNGHIKLSFGVTGHSKGAVLAGQRSGLSLGRPGSPAGAHGAFRCPCACVCVCRVHVSTHMCSCTYERRRAHTRPYMRECKCVHTHVHMCLHVHACMWFVCKRVHARVCMRCLRCMHVHTCVWRGPGQRPHLAGLQNKASACAWDAACSPTPGCRGGDHTPCGRICPPLPQAPGSCRDPGRPSAVPSPGVGAFPGVSGVSLSPATPASESEPVAVVSGGTVAPRPGTAQSSRCPSPASVQRALEDSRGGRLEPGAAQPSVGLWLRSHCGAETCDRFGQGGGSVGVQSQLGTHLPCDPAASVVSGEGDSQGP